MSNLIVSYHGLIPYEQGRKLQRVTHQLVSKGGSDQLILLQHPHVYTLGRRGSEEDILIDAQDLAEYGIDVHHTDRGGEVTYHGPGQIIGYPIINLKRIKNITPLKYVAKLQTSIASVLCQFNIYSDSEDRPTGVWVKGEKIAALGVRISEGTSSHGFALNVDTDLSYFDHIVACGMPEALATSISAQTRCHVAVEQVTRQVADSISDTFGLTLIWNDETLSKR
jgi:lipoate-protein ligase B